MVKNVQFGLDEIKKIFPVDFIQQLNRLSFCGNYGDPIVARDLLEIITYLRQINPDIRIEVNTNGSARKASWWRALAKVMGTNEDKSGVWFGLDGLEDTNHLYRRNTSWEIIMRNAKAYIDSGGIAHWNYIVFKHNEHQIEEARALAKEMGFKHFNIKLTARFHSNDTYPVIEKGKHIFDLRPPTADEHLRPEASNHIQPRDAVPRPTKAMIGAVKIIDEYKRNGFIPIEPNKRLLPKPNIVCLAQQNQGIYVSATGHVYPCCWIGIGHAGGDGDLIMDWDNIDITKRSIEDIVNGEEFQMVEDSWDIGSIVKCVHICTVVEPTDDKQKQHGNEFVIHERADNEEE